MPASLEEPVEVILVATCVAVTMTLGTTAPVVSVTAPVMVAKVDCAGRRVAQRRRLRAISIPDGRLSGITFHLLETAYSLLLKLSNKKTASSARFSENVRRCWKA